MTGLEFYPLLSLVILSDKNSEVRGQGGCIPLPLRCDTAPAYYSEFGMVLLQCSKKQDFFSLTDSFLAYAWFMVGGNGLEYPREHDDRAAGQ